MGKNSRLRRSSGLCSGFVDATSFPATVGFVDRGELILATAKSMKPFEDALFKPRSGDTAVAGPVRARDLSRASTKRPQGNAVADLRSASSSIW